MFLCRYVASVSQGLEENNHLFFLASLSSKVGNVKAQEITQSNDVKFKTKESSEIAGEN